MTFDYVVILRNNGKRSVDVMNLLLCIIAATYIVYRLAGTNYFLGYNLTSIIVLAVAMLIAYLLIAMGKRKFHLSGLILYLAGIFIISNGNSTVMERLFALALIALSAFEHKAKSNFEIGFSAQFIMFDNLFKKKYNWSEFNNIVLKDNILTLDFKNNRVYQRETIDEESDCDEDEFNEWCRQQLARINK